INAIGGDVFLLGKTVTNSGSITASGGTVGLAAGEEVLLAAEGNAAGERMFVRATGSGASGTGVLNDGTIEGAAVELKAHGNMYALAINNKGSVRATGANHSGGKVFLTGVGGSVSNSGTIRASAPGAGNSARILIEAAHAKVDGSLDANGAAGGSVAVRATESAELGGGIEAVGSTGSGGSVTVEGELVTLKASSSIRADGLTGGGSVLVGGGFQGGDAGIANAEQTTVESGSTISVDALGSGSGGTAVIWADGDTLFEGDISARGVDRGGIVEVSGKNRLGFHGTVSTLASDGTAGTLLLDPRDGIISTGGHDPAGDPFVINSNTLTSALSSNNVVVSTLDSGYADEGNLSVNNVVRWNSDFSLTLLAEGDVYVADDVINQGAGNVNIVGGWDPSVAPLGIPDGSSYNTASDVDMDADVFGVPGAFGAGEGSVYVGTRGDPFTGADRSVVVASRLGETNVAGYDVNVWGGALTGGTDTGERKYSQIGYNRIDGGTGTEASGRVRVKAVNDVDVQANKYAIGTAGQGGWTGQDRSGYASFAQIGHGGERTSVRDMDLSGEVIVEAGNDVRVAGGLTYNNHAQIGHGGFDNPDDNDGTNLAKLGGGITVSAGNHVTVQGGVGYIAQAQIGHGGYNHFLDDFTESEINVTAGGDVTLTGGPGTGNSYSERSPAQIGHGGYNADFIAVPGTNDDAIPVSAGSGKGYRGDITVSAGGKVGVHGGNNDIYQYAVIGNGGAVAEGDHSGAVNVTAGTGVEVTGGTGGSASFGQIGHVVYALEGAIDGDVAVTATTGGVNLAGGSGSANYALVGSGGYQIVDGSSIGGSTTVNSLGGDPSTDGVTLAAGTGSYTFATIGHGAARSTGGTSHPAMSLSGDTTVNVTAGGIDLQASTPGYFAHATIGHGGRDIDGDKFGAVTVNVAQGDIRIAGGGAFTSSRYTHAQIGHGGYGNGLTGNFGGDISVETLDGAVILNGADTYGGYVQIGHGGFGAGSGIAGDTEGSVRVFAGGDISLLAGSESYTFARIGHGGRDVDGSHGKADETIEVISENGNLELAGGNGADALAQIGHGDNNDSSGTRQGDILVDIRNGEISAVANGGNVAWIGHRSTTANAISDADVTIVAQSADGVAGDQSGTIFDVDSNFGAFLGANTEGGDMTVHATGTGGLLMNSTGRMVYDFSNDLNLLSESHIFFAEDILNRGTGNINAVAGWNPANAPLADTMTGIIADIDMDTDIFGVADAFGNHSSSIFVGSVSNTGTIADGADTGVRVGSRAGQTNVAGYDVNVWASPTTGGINTGNRKYSGIGYEASDAGSGSDDVTGRIRVKAENDVSVVSDKYALGSSGYTGWSDKDHSGFAAYAQIGHGGDREAVRNLNLSGEIVVEAGNDLIATGGYTREAFALVGHGGYDNPQAASTATLGGNITVDAGGNIEFKGGTGYYGFAQLGHGGKDHRIASFTESGISATAGGDIVFSGGDVGNAGTNRIENYAQLGHGGSDSSVLTAGEGYGGKITVAAGGAVTFAGGANTNGHAKIGHGGEATVGDHYGDICVVAGDGVSLDSGAETGTNGFVQIGHGGIDSGGDLSGAVSVISTGGAVTVNGGNSTGRFAQIGHGGGGSGGDMSGSIAVVALDGTTTGSGDVSLIAGTGGSGRGALVGHGDADSTTSGDRTGGINIYADGEIVATPGTGTSGAFVNHQTADGDAAISYAASGIGPFSGPGPQGGYSLVGRDNITLTAGEQAGLTTVAAKAVQDGHFTLATGGDTDFTFSGPDILWGGDYAFTIATGGSITIHTAIQNSGTGSVNLAAGWLGNGAASVAASGISLPDLTFTCEPDFDYDFSFNCDNTGENGSTVTIGSAAQTSRASVGSRDGTTGVYGDGIVMRAGDNDGAAAQIGFFTDGSEEANGAIDIAVAQSGLTMTSGDGVGAFTQIGHGGFGAVDDAIDSAITISFCDPGGIVDLNGGGANSYAQIGHGVAGGGAARSGTIQIGNFTALTLDGGGDGAYAQIGHGGTNSGSDLSGAIVLTGNAASGSVDVRGGGGDRGHAQIGHGGNSATGTFAGDILVNIDPLTFNPTSGAGSVTVSGGSAADAYAQIGHGGDSGAAFTSGNVVVFAPESVTVAAGSAEDAYAQIGHGGHDNDGGHGLATDAIVVIAGGEIDLDGGNTGARTYAQIGHGGTDADGDLAGGVFVNFDPVAMTTAGGGGALTVHGGAANNAYAQIGHGGFGAVGDHDGDLAVRSAGGGLMLSTGGGLDAYAQIGHGGRSASGSHSGAIDVETAGDIGLAGSGGGRSYSKIGHGGNDADEAGGLNDGTISVTSSGGSLSMAAGSGFASGAQIGHGGINNSNKTGVTTASAAINVAIDGDVILTAGAGNNSYAQIGHGGTNSRTTHLGDICVHVGGQVSLDSTNDGGSVGVQAYTQIGNGGRNASGDHEGDITVVSGTNATGGVVLRGGTGAGSEGQYAQIGHGGNVTTDTAPDLRGDISVIADNGGDIVLAGGANVTDYAMIGHGDAEGETLSGTREGGIHIFADGALTATNGAGVENVNIYHQTGAPGGMAANYLGGDGFQLVANGGTTLPDSAVDDISAMTSANQNGGAISFAISNDVDVVVGPGNGRNVNTSEDFYILTGGSITMLSSYQNSGDGDVILVAGWDGTGATFSGGSVSYGSPVDFCAPVISEGQLDSFDFNNCEAFGNDAAGNGFGTVTVGSESQATGVAVGSRSGSNFVAGYGLTIYGGDSVADTYTQLGFRPTAAAPGATSDISVFAKAGGVSLLSGEQAGSYAQIGHGGLGSFSSSTVSEIALTFCEPGAVMLDAGTGNSYSQIGHGGLTTTGTRGGDISIVGDVATGGAGTISLLGGSQTHAYAQIGHGGLGGGGATSGDIRMRSMESVGLTGGTGQDAYAQIGHGGHDRNNVGGSHGALDDRIVVIAADGVSLTGGDTVGAGYGAYAQIGNGGYDADADLLGDIYINYDPVTGLADGGGDIRLLASTKTTNESNFGTVAQIGHGGRNQSGEKRGDIVIGNAADVLVQGARNLSFARIGHGGNGNASGDAFGDVKILASTGVTLQGGAHNESHAHIGHGGSSYSGSKIGDVAVNSSGAISILGGSGTGGYAHIGHGGVNSGGTMTGTVGVIAGGTLLLDSGAGSDTYAKVGHGGRDSDGSLDGDIFVNYDPTAATAAGGGDITLSGRIGGGGSFSQIGHGGRQVNGALSGDIVIGTADALSIVGGGGSTNFSKIGHGGNDNDAGDINGDTSGSIEILESTSVEVRGGTASFTFAQIGHGGYQVTGNHGAAGDVIRVLSSGDISVVGGSTEAFAQIGHGGKDSGGTHAADITVDAGGSIDVGGGTGSQSFGMIGHGGDIGVVNTASTVTVASGGDLTLKADTTNGFAQIGHGGRSASGTISAAHVTVNVAGAIVLEADQGSGNSAYAQIGHGGYEATNLTAAGSDIRINEATGTGAGAVTLLGGSGTNSYAQIGHGGARPNGTRRTGNNSSSGDIVVGNATGIYLTGGTNADSSARIGHGGEGAVGDFSGRIELFSTADLILTSGSGNDTLAQIGHGGRLATGNLDGEICVRVETGATLDSDAFSASDGFTQIGHGGAGTDGTSFSGGIVVTGNGGDIALFGGVAGAAGQYAQIGHGGTNSDADMSGDVYVVADNGGDIALTGGDSASNYAMIGHGDAEGRTTTGTREGGIHIFADGTLTATNGNGAPDDDPAAIGNVNIYHQTEGDGNGVGLTFPGTYLGGDGYQVFANGGVNVAASARNDESAIISGNMGEGPIRVMNAADTPYVLNAGNDLYVDTPNDFFILSGGDITLLSSYQNAGAGTITLVAGWDGTGVSLSNDASVTFNNGDYCDPVIKGYTFVVDDFNNCEFFGNDANGDGAGTVTLGSSTQTTPVYVGSRRGDTRVFGAGLNILGGSGTDAASQLGFRPDGSGDVTGDIFVRLKDLGLELSGGSGDGSFAQIGHGGTGGVQGGVSLEGAIDISFCQPGDVDLLAGGSFGSYAQIGHGGNDWDGARNGTIDVRGAADITLRGGGQDGYAQIGHGGSGIGGAYGTGDVNGAISLLGTAGKVTLQGDTGVNSYAQVGHGGLVMRGRTSGDIEVEAGIGGVLLQGGGDNRAYALIGNGGYNGDRLVEGDVTVRATGVAAGDGIELVGGDGSNAGAGIGNGNYFNTSDVTGDTTVEVTAGGLLLQGGDGDYSYVNIGHGNREDDGNLSGDVDVTVQSGGLRITGGTEGYFSHAMIGHGGRDVRGDRSGEINVTVSQGDIGLTGGGDFTTSRYAHAQIGHGGYLNSGSGQYVYSGAVTVEASDGQVILQNGEESSNYVQIGHGGHSNGQAHADADGEITVRGSEGVSVLATGASASHAQIGNGGTRIEGTLGGNVRVESSNGGVRLEGGATSGAYALIGNGAFRPGDASSVSGDVTVIASGTAPGGSGVSLTAGEGAYSFAQIGHAATSDRGGSSHPDIPLSGNITVDVVEGGLVLQAADTGYFSHAMIGHGGRDANGSKTGSIDVTVDSGDIDVFAGGPFTSSRYAHAQIGHGGYGNGLTGDYIGGISLEVTDGSLSIVGGETYGSYAQVGHGGFGAGSNITGNMTGSIDVGVENDIELRTGDQSYTFSRIGHGGRGVDGNHGGADEFIKVVSRSGNLELEAIAGSDSIAQIGHGENNDGSGTRQGDILVDVAGEISLVRNPNPVWIGHRTTDGTTAISDADVTIRSTSLDYATGLSGTGLFHIGDTFDSMMSNNLAGGHVSLIGRGGDGIWSNQNIRQNSVFDLNLLSHADIYMAADAINQGSGDVNLVAGWDPAVSDLSGGVESAPYRYYWVRDVDMDVEIFSNPASYANGTSSVWVGANQDLTGADISVVVASRTGQTNVAGHDVNVWGGAVTGGIDSGHRKYSQIGYNRIDGGTGTGSDVTGRIRVKAVNDVAVEANHYAIGTEGYSGWGGQDRSGYASFAQIGHGGERTSVRDMKLSGEIIIEAGGDLGIVAGQTINNHAQVGHGGFDNADDNDGTNDATLGGEITVDVGGSVSLQGGVGYLSHAQIGHGGYTHFLDDFTESAVNVTAGGDVILTGGPGTGNSNSRRSMAQIGHGGYGADFIEVPGTADDHVPVSAGSGRGYKGDITIDAGGAVHVHAGADGEYNYAVIGNGGVFAEGDHSGKVTVNAGSGVEVFGGTGGSPLFAQIGHVAYASEGHLDGDTNVTTTSGGVSLRGGDSTANYALIGNGGYNLRDGVSVSGNTVVSAMGGDPLNDGISILGGDGSYAFASIGHGALNSQSGSGGHPSVNLSGNVDVSVESGGVTLQASTDGYFSHAMIGHGGRDIGGTKSGAVTVTADSGDIEVLAGGDYASSSRYNHAQIGHGGYGNGLTVDSSGEVTVEAVAGAIALRGGGSYGNYSQIGHGGFGAGNAISGMFSGDVSVAAGGSVGAFGGGEQNTYSMVGHGGIDFSGPTAGNVSVFSGGGGGVSLLGG
ncbi:MAG: hypothetical protein WD342_20715, partial [Verrucomicrobiales bacterium]